jgi:hypothetical protein
MHEWRGTTAAAVPSWESTMALEVNKSDWGERSEERAFILVAGERGD